MGQKTSKNPILGDLGGTNLFFPRKTTKFSPKVTPGPTIWFGNLLENDALVGLVDVEILHLQAFSPSFPRFPLWHRNRRMKS